MFNYNSAKEMEMNRLARIFIKLSGNKKHREINVAGCKNDFETFYRKHSYYADVADVETGKLAAFKYFAR